MHVFRLFSYACTNPLFSVYMTDCISFSNPNRYCLSILLKSRSKMRNLWPDLMSHILL